MQLLQAHAVRRIALGALCCFLSSVPIAAQQVADLDPGQATIVSTPYGTNEGGDAVGIAFISGFDEAQAVLFTDGVGASMLPLLAGDEGGTAWDISETGDAVGESIDITMTQPGFWTVTPHAVIWEGGVPITIESMVVGGSGFNLRQAVAINEHGQIVVQGRDPKAGGLHGFLYEDGALTPIPHLNPALQSTESHEMNEQGQVVGVSHSLVGFPEAFLWEDGVTMSLHDTTQIPGTVSSAHAINEAGVIVGDADFTPDFGQFHTAAIWDHGTVTNLGALEVNAEAYALDINDHGTVVGVSGSSFGDRAFIVEKDGTMEDLNDRLAPGSGWILLSAQCITNDGRIYGEGVFGGKNRPYVYTPDCSAAFSTYATASTGSGDFEPRLWGQGCLDGGAAISLAITNGFGGEAGLLLVGNGISVFPFKQGLDLAILPLTPLSVPLTLGGFGAGAGAWQLGAKLPASLPPVQITLQAILLDPGTPSGFSITNALMMDFQ